MVTLETYATKKWKPMLLASNDRPSGIGTYKDNGGVCYAGQVVTRTGQTQATSDIITVQAVTDIPLGIAVQVLHLDQTDWDFDEIAADNDVVKVAMVGSKHVVAAYLQSAQGDLFAGRLLYAGALGYLLVAPVAASSGDSVDDAQQTIGRSVGRLYEDVLESTVDPKVEILAKVILDV